MELEHSFTVPVPRDRAWDVLLDVERVAPCMPGATIDSVDGDEIRGRIKVKVGPINMTYAGTARFVEKDKATGVVRLEASGRETRGAGTAAATVRSVLEDKGDHTDVIVLTTLNVTGRPAQFGRGVMNEVGGRLLTIFATNLATTLAAPDDGSEGPQDSGSGGRPAGAGSGDQQSASQAPAQTRAREPELVPAAAPVNELGLPARAVACLERAGLATVGQVAAKSADQLLAIDGIGPASVDEIKAKLADRGLALGQAAAAAEAVTAAAEAAAPADQVGPAPAEPAEAQAPASAHAHEHPRADAVRAAAHQLEDDAINLLKVAGMPVLKRALPVLAALAVALVIGLRKRLRRR